jgi:hypothetical protein
LRNSCGAYAHHKLETEIAAAKYGPPRRRAGINFGFGGEAVIGETAHRKNSRLEVSAQRSR